MNIVSMLPATSAPPKLRPYDALQIRVLLSWLLCTVQFECGGMVLEEAPGKVSEAFRLFLQGMGYGVYFFNESVSQFIWPHTSTSNYMKKNLYCTFV